MTAGIPQIRSAGEAATAPCHAEIPMQAGGDLVQLPVPARPASTAPHAAAWRGSLVVFTVASALLGWMFRAEIGAAVQVWSSSATFGHAFLIAPISLFLLYRMRHRLAMLEPAPASWAAVPIVLFTLLWVAGEATNVLVIKQTAFVGLWQSLFFLVMGWPVTRAALFPLLYLYFAVPAGSSAIPILQDATAQIVVYLLRLSGMPVFLDGFLIQIPSGRFLVAEACSGVRYLIVSIALGVLVAHLFLRSWPRRLLFVSLSAVVPIAANGVRAYGIIMLAHLSDYRIAADVDHVVYGFVFLSVVSLSLLGLAVMLRERDGVKGTASQACEASRPRRSARTSLAAQVTCSGAALAAVLLVQVWVTTAREAPAVLTPALQLPEADPWQAGGSAAPLWSPRFHKPDLVLRDSYRLGSDQVDAHVAYYAYQREGAEAISQLNDLARVDRPWHVLQAGLAEASINGRDHRFIRVLLSNQTSRYLLWYWYRVAGKNVNSRLLGKLLELRALLPGAEQAASVIAIGTRVSEDARRADAVIEAFLVRTLDGNGTLVRRGPARAAVDPEAAP